MGQCQKAFRLLRSDPLFPPSQSRSTLVPRHGADCSGKMRPYRDSLVMLARSAKKTITAGPRITPSSPTARGAVSHPEPTVRGVRV